MPGLVGIVRKKPVSNIKQVFDALLAPMQRGRRLQSEYRIALDEQWALGRVHLGTLQPTTQLAIHDSVQFLFHGDLSNEAELRDQFAIEASLQHTDTVASLIRALYRTHGTGFASRLQGAFCAVVLDETLKRVVL